MSGGDGDRHLTHLPRDAQLQRAGFDFDFAEIGLLQEGRQLPDQLLIDACFAHLACITLWCFG
jgi:hypothetical protein